MRWIFLWRIVKLQKVWYKQYNTISCIDNDKYIYFVKDEYTIIYIIF